MLAFIWDAIFEHWHQSRRPCMLSAFHFLFLLLLLWVRTESSMDMYLVVIII